MRQLDKVNQFINKYLVGFMVIIVVIALIAPWFFTPLASLKFTTIRIADSSFTLTLTNVLLAIIMFGTGTSMQAGDIVQIFKAPRDVIIGVASKFIFMAAGAYLIAKLLGLDSELAFGLILLGCMPPGTAAGVLVLIARGEVSLSIAITVIATLIAPILTPVLTFLLGGEWVSIDFLGMVITIMIVVMIPVICGIVLRSILKDKLDNFKRILTLLSLISILLIIAVSTAPNRAVVLSSSSIIVMVAVLLNFLFVVLASWLLSKLLRLNGAKSRAMMITSSEQNSGLSVGISMSFSDIYPAAAIPSIMGVVFNLIAATALTNILSRRADRNVTGTAESVEDEQSSA